MLWGILGEACTPYIVVQFACMQTIGTGQRTVFYYYIWILIPEWQDQTFQLIGLN